MAKVTPISEHFQHFLADVKETFWGDLYGRTQAAWKQFLEADSVERRDRYAVREAYQRQPYRNGYYERDFVTRLGTIRLRIARTRGKSFLPRGLKRFQRRAEEVSLLIREAFLRGSSTRQVGRVVATLSGEVVSAQTVSKLTRGPGRSGASVPPGAAGGRVCLFISGWSEPAGRGASGCRCRWPTACAATAAVTCWPFCAAREKARRTGKLCSRICTGAGWRASIWG